MNSSSNVEEDGASLNIHAAHIENKWRKIWEASPGAEEDLEKQEAGVKLNLADDILD